MWQVSARTAHVHLPSTAEATSLGSAEGVASWHLWSDHLFNAAKQFLVLEFLVGEANQRLESGLVAEPVFAANLQYLRAYKALAQPKHVRVGTALDLADQKFLAGAEKAELADRSIIR